MIGADKTIRWSTAAAVIGVAVVAAVMSYEHAHALVRVHGETGWTACSPHSLATEIRSLRGLFHSVPENRCWRDTGHCCYWRFAVGAVKAASVARSSPGES